MADEEAQVESTTETNDAVEETNDSEVAKTQIEPTEGGSDFKKAMYEERTKRQTLEQRLNDPNFVYERAKALGLTSEEETPAEETFTQKPQVPENVPYIVRRELRIAKAVEKYPEITTDENLGTMVTALINKGMDPVEAADTVLNYAGKAKEEGVKEGAKAKERQISDKEKAHTLTSGVTEEDMDMSEIESLRRKVRDTSDRSASEKALVEVIKRRNKEAGIF